MPLSHAVGLTLGLGLICSLTVSCGGRQLESHRKPHDLSVAPKASEATPQRTGSSPASHQAKGQTILTVRVAVGSGGNAQVFWSSHDGNRSGLLNPVYGASEPTWRGAVSAETLFVYVDGLGESEPFEASHEVDLRSGMDKDIALSLSTPRKVVSWKVAVTDPSGKPIAGLRGEPVIDGSATSFRTAAMNYDQWWTDEAGQLTVRAVEGESVAIALTVPLSNEPLVHTVGPFEGILVLRGVALVRCYFRCPATGRPSTYPGFVAVAELRSGETLRYELPESDALRSEPVVVAWPPQTKRLTVSSSPYVPVTLSSKGARCELRPLSARQCGN